MRWLDVQRRWPLWSAARDRQAAVAVLDAAISNLTSEADLLTEILALTAIQPRSLLPLLDCGAHQRRHTRDLRALSTRPGLARDARLLRDAATAIDELAAVIERIADLHASLAMAPAPSHRQLAQLLLDGTRLTTDAWTRTRAGAPVDLQLRGLARICRQAASIKRRAGATFRYDGQHDAALAAREITARQARAIALMSGPLLIVLLTPRRARDELITGSRHAGTIASTRVATGTPTVMPGTRFRGRDSVLVALFGRAGRNVHRTAELLDQLLTDWPESQGLRAAILDCEHVGDRITHDIIHELHTAAPRTLDREDVFGLAAALDDIVDYAEEVADCLGLYHIEAPMEAAQQLARVLRDATASLAGALDGLSHVETIGPRLIEIHHLENEADRIVRGAIASLFVGGIDPTVIIRWKDLFDRLEDAIDSCEKAAHVLQGIAVKHG